MQTFAVDNFKDEPFTIDSTMIRGIVHNTLRLLYLLCYGMGEWVNPKVK